jgi:hypothetical protein
LTRQQRALPRIYPTAAAIPALEPYVHGIADDLLPARVKLTGRHKNRGGSLVVLALLRALAVDGKRQSHVKKAACLSEIFFSPATLPRGIFHGFARLTHHEASMNSEISVPDVVRMFDDVLPSKSDRKFVFQQLIDSIDYCEQLGSAAWSVTLASWGFRLNVGQVEVMTCSFVSFVDEDAATPDEIWVVTLRIFLAGDDPISKIKLDDEVEAIEEGNYSSVGAQHCCYIRCFEAAKSSQGPCDPSRDDFEAKLRTLRPHRDRYLHLACHTSTGKLRQKSNFARSHCPALYEVARSMTTAEVETANAPPLGATQQRSAALRVRSSDGRPDSGEIPSAATITQQLPEHTMSVASDEEAEGGYIYLLVNRSMPGLVKIGRTNRAIGTRVRELSTPTGVPTPFEVILDVFVKDSAKAERLVHERLASHRTAPNREFFEVVTSTAIQVIYSAVLAVNGRV